MKWFTATNESSLGEDQFFELLAAAVLSAQKNTSLDPHLLYEGDLQHERLRWLEQKGVTVVPHELSFRDEIEAYCRANGYGQDRVRVRTGAYLRSELPVALMEDGIDDNFVLYTDCDVLFIRNPDLEDVAPENFAAYGHWEGGYTRYNFGGYKHYSSGVMVMNVKSMYEDSKKFIEFVLHDGYNVSRPQTRYWQDNLILHDQVAYNLFYKGRIDDLGKKYNWNPSSGINKDAFIIHFNGMKWNQVKKFKKGTLEQSNPKLKKYRKMYESSGGAYDYYRNIARSLLADAQLQEEMSLMN